MRKVFFALVFLLFSAPVFAQLNNSAFYKNRPVLPQNEGDLRLNLEVLGFSKNNEYFNKMADGYTLFGYLFNPKLTWQPAKHIRVDGGLLFQKDFGADRLRQLQPTLTIKIQEENYQLLFGTLQGHLQHGYIEPLYDFERVMLNRAENGIQYIYTKPNFSLDAWIDWQRMIYRDSPFQEEIAGGISSEWRAWQSTDSSWLFTVPLQFTAQHHGGQIDSTEKPLLTVFNGAAGFTLEKRFRNGKVNSIYSRNYATGFLDYSNAKLFPYENGSGIYLNAGIDTKWQEFMLSYWEGNKYLALMGGPWYQSASRSYNDSGYVEPNRRLLIARFMHDIKLWDENLILTLRLEPVYDFNDTRLNFSNSFYLNFNTDIFLKKVRRVEE